MPSEARKRELKEHMGYQIIKAFGLQKYFENRISFSGAFPRAKIMWAGRTT